jgi:hypothetical protein
MYKYTVLFFLLMSAFMVTAVYSQVSSGMIQTRTVSGTVDKIDFAGSTISIQTDDQHEISFSVPANAIITRDTRDIGLMDLAGGHPVTIQYDISSPGKNIAESIVDHKSASHEEEQ